MMQRQLQLPFLVTYIGVEQWALEALVDTLWCCCCILATLVELLPLPLWMTGNARQASC